VVFIWNIQGKIRENEHICPLTVYIKKKYGCDPSSVIKIVKMKYNW
jgi:hypothetical protein